MRTMLAIKTHMKNDVLQCLLTSIKNHGYADNEIVIADDNPPEAFQVFKDNKFVTAYLAGSRHGIAYNNNRLIRYFLHRSKCERLALLDNDICFLRPGMLESIEQTTLANGIQHIAAYIIDADGNDGLQKSFPAQALSKDRLTKWHPGSHGVMQWYTRELMDKVGYFVRMPYFYGGEHSEHSNRAIISQDHDPRMYPVFARSTRYIQSCPVNFHAYDVDLSKTYNENHKVMHERLNERTLKGLDLKEFNSHLDDDRELIILQEDAITLDGIKVLISKPKAGNKRGRK